MTLFTINHKGKQARAMWLTLIVTLFIFIGNIMAQEKNQMVRLAKITVDPSQLEKYNAALKEQMSKAEGYCS